MTNPKTFNKVFVALTFFLMLFYIFNLGIDAANSDGKEAIVDGVLAAFWLFSYVLFGKMNRESDKLDRELDEAHKNLHHALGDAFAEISKELEKEIKAKEGRREQFTKIFKEVTGTEFTKAKSISARNKASVERKFNEATGLFANIKVKSDGVIGVDVTDVKPQPAAPATKKAPVKKPVAKAAPVTKKPVTKKGK